MNFLNTVLSTLLITAPMSTLMVNNLLANIDTANQNKVLDMDFDSNKILNKVNNKEYTPSANTFKYASSLKGNAFEFNNSRIDIPFKDLNLSEKDDTITVSFLMKWENDTNFMPVSGSYNLWIRDGKIGFNSGCSEIYGVNKTLEKDKYYSIIAEFNRTDLTKNVLYIDGVKQQLSYVMGSYSISKPWTENTTMSFGGAINANYYNVNDKTTIDEIKIYNKKLNENEINDITNSHKIPILRGDVVNNSYTKLTWATEILPENILYRFGFERDEQSGINLVYNSANNRGTGGQKFTNETSFSGEYSLMTPQTTPDKGNVVTAPYTVPSNKNALYYESLKLGFDQGIPISSTFKAKTNTEGGLIFLSGNWQYDSEFTFYNSYTLEDYPAGTQYIKVSNNNIFPLSTKGYSHVTLDLDAFSHEQNLTGSIVDRENGIMKLSAPLKRAVAKGTQLRQRKMVSMFQFPELSIIADGNWNLYNANSYISTTVDIDWNKRPQMLRQSWIANDDLYIDDIIVGHATKVRLYRDNTKIYEGYGSEFADTSATDKTKPSTVSSIKSEMSYNNDNRKLTINFNPSIDTGSVYNYNISAVSNDNVETPKSETITQIITSGLKGYSYIIDNKSSTVPDNTVDTTNTTITKDFTNNESGTYYLHIKAIDNAGNVGDTVHYKIDIPVLTAQAKPTENSIKLDWTMNDINNKTFKVYQKKPGSNEFQSISTTDISKDKVRVLNVYPTYSYKDKSNGKLDLAGKVEKVSAVLSDWMNGFDKGALDIKSINKEDFEANPDKWLKNANGQYQFDVIAFGFSNMGNTGYGEKSHHLNNTGLKAISDFIDSGRGVLTGHQSIGLFDFDQGMNLIKDKFNVLLFKEKNAPNLDKGNIDVILDTNTKVNEYQSYYWCCGNEVKAVKKGSLLNYPHDIATEGQIFTIPHSHSGYAFIMGDNWFEYNEVKAHNLPEIHDGYAPDTSSYHDVILLNQLDGKSGTNNSYLSTWNNTAIIQTGHSGDFPTNDERKILANTLFYLNQLSTNNYLNDNSGQDINSPNKPIITGHIFTEDGFININFDDVKDNGSTYSYYVESNNKTGDSITISNTITETITTGVKGYSYIVDDKADTIPDNVIEQTNNSAIKLKANNEKELYIHIKSIDNAGNSSETLHYRITDMEIPLLNFELRPSTWTNGEVTIIARATDNSSGVKNITLPNGTIVKSSEASFIVNKNGLYTFKCLDYMGNEGIYNLTITNIDKNKPTVTISNNKNWTNKDVQVTITATDE